MNPDTFEIIAFAPHDERGRSSGEFEQASRHRGCTPPLECERPIGGAAAEGEFSSLTRGGFRWYTPKHNDTRWALARQILTWLHDDGRASAPTAGEIMKLAVAIRDAPCNSHLRHRMMLPRFKSDRFTCGGSNYGAIFIPVKNLVVRRIE
jgi:hypothetical protein